MSNVRVYLTNAFLACFDLSVLTIAAVINVQTLPPAPLLFSWAALFFHFGMYRSRRLDGPLADAVILLKACIAGGILGRLAAPVFPNSALVPFIGLQFIAFSFVLLVAARTVLRAALQLLRRHGYNVRRVVLIASEEVIGQLEDRIGRNAHYGYRIVARFVFRESGADSERGLRNSVREFLASTPSDDVILALPSGTNALAAGLLRECENHGVHVRIVPDTFPLVQTDAQIYNFDGIPLINARIYPADRPGYAVLKRIFDIGVSLVALILLSPLFLCLAILIVRNSPGPVLFIQERVGMNGRRFRIFKFRTMSQDRALNPDTHWTVRDDRHVTPVGRWLRRTNLDELPQLFNVLRGEMSIVGPRPERPFFLERFRREVPEYMARHYVKSGMTGWAQVNGWRGDTDIPQRVAHDLYYIRNWTISFDLRILCLTLARAFLPGMGGLQQEERRERLP